MAQPDAGKQQLSFKKVLQAVEEQAMVRTQIAQEERRYFSAMVEQALNSTQLMQQPVQHQAVVVVAYKPAMLLQQAEPALAARFAFM
jgi:hypothetical protein